MAILIFLFCFSTVVDGIHMKLTCKMSPSFPFSLPYSPSPFLPPPFLPSSPPLSLPASPSILPHSLLPSNLCFLFIHSFFSSFFPYFKKIVNSMILNNFPRHPHFSSIPLLAFLYLSTFLFLIKALFSFPVI